MPSRIDIGPEGGPFVEIDEENGDLVIRVPNDQIDFANSDIVNVGDTPFADDPHDNTQHSETFLANGENFDGQGTSSLTNLAAVETEQQTIGNVVGRAATTTNQTIPNDTITQIEIGNVVVDDYGGWSTANNEYVFQNGGKYMIIACVTVGDINLSGVGTLRYSINNDRINLIRFDGQDYSSQNTLPAQPKYHNATENDVLTFEIFQQSGSDGEIKSGATNEQTYFEIIRIG